MDHIDLEPSLDRPTCIRCKLGRIRPIAINGEQLLFDCPHCKWRFRADLPQIRKTIIYLDTSTVSHMASALRNGEKASQWLRLEEALRASAADDVICCVDSSIIRHEAELSPYAAEIVSMSQGFGDPHPRHELDVQYAQLFRALDRFLAGAPVTKETSLPWQDAFEDDPHRWQEPFRIDAEWRYSPTAVQGIRATKTNLEREFTQIYASYAADGLGFEGIQKLEASGFGKGIIADGLRAIQCRLSLSSTEPSDNTVGLVLPTTFDLIVESVKQKTGLDYSGAIAKTIDFLNSEHTSSIPVAEIGAWLHAGLAVAARGPKPRLSSPSDSGDITHIATFMPYVDIFVADRYFASLCNRSDIKLGNDYGTTIRTLGEGDIDAFIAELDRLHNQCPHADLSRRIQRSINDGGYIQERTNALKEWESKTVSPPDVSDSNFREQ